jgi:predicted dehydrogenase
VNPLKLAVVGAGHLGRIHARLLAQMPDVELVGIADPSSEARALVAAECQAPAWADHRELLSRVEAAVVATPTRFHHAVAVDFLRHGTPLLVEKPICATVEEANELVELAARRGVVLQVGHIERFNPAFAAVHQRVGRTLFVDAVRASGFTGRSTDISVVHDLMIHDIDLVLTLIEAPLERVDAVGLALLGRPLDAAQARLEFSDGAVANLSASRVSYSPAPTRRMHVWGSDAFAAIDFGNRTASVVQPCDDVKRGTFDYESLSAAERATFKDRVLTELLRVEPVELESRNALADELRDFVDAVRAAAQPRVTGRAGRDALAVAEAVVSSALSHRGQPRPAPAPILRGPHWHLPAAQPARREAG